MTRAALSMLALALGGDAAAGVIVVTTSDDEFNGGPTISFREAIDAASSGDDIQFSLAEFPTSARTTILLTAALGSLPDVAAGVDTTTLGDVGSIGANYIHGNGKSGIKLSTLPTGASVEVRGSQIGVDPLTGGASGNCVAPASGQPCAGIMVDAYSAVDASVWIDGNVIVATLGDPSVAQGSGILIAGGAGHLIENNAIGLLDDGTSAGNVGRGIEVVGASIPDVSILANTVSSNGRSGIGLGPGSSSALVQGNFIGIDQTGQFGRDRQGRPSTTKSTKRAASLS